MSGDHNMYQKSKSKPMEILEEVYGPTEWSESALINLFRVMELTREDERIRQMANMEDYQKMLVDNILHLLHTQQQATGDRHNYWMVAANLIKAEFGEKE
jgi:hypothetical protein